MRDGIDQYYADKGKYPASLDSLVSDGYLRKIPDDPITQSSTTWTTVPAEPDPANPSAEAGDLRREERCDRCRARWVELRGLVGVSLQFPVSSFLVFLFRLRSAALRRRQLNSSAVRYFLLLSELL